LRGILPVDFTVMLNFYFYIRRFFFLIILKI
jgi:hypothetical protein